MAIRDGHQLREAKIHTLANICSLMAILDGHQQRGKYSYNCVCIDGHPGCPSTERSQNSHGIAFECVRKILKKFREVDMMFGIAF
jgi:hypothetical protein